MHEYSLACSIVENILSIAESNQAKSVNSITLGVGKLTHVNPDQLSFCVETLIEETVAGGAEIIFNDIFPDMECECGFSDNGKSFCPSGEEGFDDIRTFLEVPCPSCGKILFASGGRELVIESIDIEQ